jgi:pyruvate/2-oxoglutarate dehydrogenase complex dihydrolipoamide dehydrogenase (E3) component
MTPTEHDLVVIGGGPAGVAAVERARELGARVALVRPPALQVGGDVSARVLTAAAAQAPASRGNDGYGNALRARSVLDLGELRARAGRIVVAQQMRIDARLRACGVTIVEGFASFCSAHGLRVTGAGPADMLATARTIVAVGAGASRPATVAYDGRSIVSVDDVLSLDRVPTRLTIVGASPLGLEYASAFAALGTRVFLLEQAPVVSSIADGRALAALLEQLARQGVEIRTSSRAIGARREGDGTVSTMLDGQPPVVSRAVIWAAGLRGATDDLDLFRAHVAVERNGMLAVDARGCTSNPDVFAAGAVVDGRNGSIAAARSGRAAASAALDSDPGDHGWPLARVLHTIPELAAVGPSSAELVRLGIPFVRGVGRPRAPLAIELGDDGESILELLVSPGERTLLAAQAFGPRALAALHVAQLAIGLSVTVDAIALVPFSDPDIREAYRLATDDAVLHLPEPVAT